MGIILVPLAALYGLIALVGVVVGVRFSSEGRGFLTGARNFVVFVLLAFMFAFLGFVLACAFMSGERQHGLIFSITMYFSLLAALLVIPIIIPKNDASLAKIRSGFFLSPALLPIVVYYSIGTIPELFHFDLSWSH